MKQSASPSESARKPGLPGTLTDHRTIGRQYLALSLIAVAIGTILSLLMRIHLVWPDLVLPRPFRSPILPEDYLALVTLHGTLMVFFVLTTAPQSGFGNLILPSQIGARGMAFPWLNAMSFWITALALLTLLSSIFVPAGAAISGWTAYPPLSAVASAGPGQALGQDLWLASIALFAIGATGSAINTLTTIVRLRCDGMTWERLPLTVWGWFTAALLSILAFSVLLAAILLLFCDRHANTSFFIPAGDLVSSTLHERGNGSPLLWLHLFWFFGHPEVYIAILPGMGLTSMLLATFSRRRVFAYRTMIVTTLLIGFLGILLWGHHMFVAGLNPFASSTFSVSTMAIAIPASAKVISWLATTWRSRPTYSTPMLFALGFVSLFITGGLTGPILAQPILDEYLHNTFFVVAHFHLIMAMAGVFSLFAAT
jgi:cytochrome c oxidase subunit I